MRNEELDRRYRAIAWGVFFVIIGVLSIVPGDQTGLGILAGGLLLLGLNLLRSLRGMPVGGFSLTIGAVALIGGVLTVMRSRLGLHFEVDLFPILLIAIGVYILWPSPRADEGAAA